MCARLFDVRLVDVRLDGGAHEAHDHVTVVAWLQRIALSAKGPSFCSATNGGDIRRCVHEEYGNDRRISQALRRFGRARRDPYAHGAESWCLTNCTCQRGAARHRAAVDQHGNAALVRR